MITSERGFSIGETVGGARINEGWSGGARENALENQAGFVVRQFMIDQMNGVSPTIWYEWSGDKFGLLDKSGKPRPAYNAACEMLKQ